jgi:hypothetical protein
MPPADTVTDRHRRRAFAAPALAVALIAVTALVAACGGGSPSQGVANLSTSKTTSSQTSAPTSGAGAGGSAGPSTSAGGPGPGSVHSGFAIAGGNRQNALKLAACMRAKGVPNFPDPNSSGVIQGTNIDPGSPQFQAAQKKCRKYAGGLGAPSPAQQAQAQAQALKFSACMRSHGVTGFPDPQFQTGGGISIRIKGGAGSTLDPQSPIFQKAQQTCGGKNGPLGPGPSGSK